MYLPSQQQTKIYTATMIIAVSAASRTGIYDCRQLNCDGWNNFLKFFNFFAEEERPF